MVVLLPFAGLEDHNFLVDCSINRRIVEWAVTSLLQITEWLPRSRIAILSLEDPVP